MMQIQVCVCVCVCAPAHVPGVGGVMVNGAAISQSNL